ncbi:hypothetical protein SEVIR_9G560500v4 [Setaria viridis]|uniref:Uncharacterized protein n=2 Tax=Setaria TaxID=4554 RepID=K4AG06_SETIT|nr:uncharacterized protein LOC101759070 [Setaria italica]XP_034575492.1 uncharacterized protein LOC117839296 [Setaria viridis]RCV46751.1 hypothetical protein SETIT_9G556300v2 [Setaria italica]TKV98443.1 hypothetical protein SEVIR_9G560500v2 [Setaria viridis]
MATPRKQQPQPQGAVSVQHVAKASSDELLRKFADPDARHLATTPPRRSLALRRKRSSRRVASGLSARDSEASASAGAAELAAPKRRRSIGGSADWRAGLLLPTTTAASARKGQARRGGAARLDDAAGIGLILAALERTWRKTVAGASKMFVERHRTNHVLLISDMV